eukprot:TRINITY_DN3164_c0_g1_i1.p1 TRINITY_DN3164_c0_g1~~TRINITY_DN3164_c0_g1_i1.p1  ORF type:complete len:429 (-),score=96.99 TRINITY_DN3164_c0_g1_i1:1123-2409(-)
MSRTARAVGVTGATIDFFIENSSKLIKHYKHDHVVYKYVMLGRDMEMWLKRNTGYSKGDSAAQFCEVLLKRGIICSALDDSCVEFKTGKDGIYCFCEDKRIDISHEPLDDIIPDILFYSYDELSLSTRAFQGEEFYECFDGDAMVNWLLRRTNVSNREVAINICQMLLNRNIIAHIGNEPQFQDKSFAYRFTRKSRCLIGHKIKSGDDVVFYRTWEPDNNIRNGVIVHFHDFGSNSLGNMEEYEYLTRAGFVVCVIDLRGCGRSSGIADGIQNQINDIKLVIQKLEEKYDNYPVFFSGIGYGGFLSLLVAQEKLSCILAGVISSSPLILGDISDEELQSSLSSFMYNVDPVSLGSSLKKRSEEYQLSPEIPVPLLLVNEKSHANPLNTLSPDELPILSPSSTTRTQVKTRKSRLDVTSRWSLEQSLHY